MAFFPAERLSSYIKSILEDMRFSMGSDMRAEWRRKIREGLKDGKKGEGENGGNKKNYIEEGKERRPKKNLVSPYGRTGA